MILSHFSGAAVPFWWCSQVRVARMVFIAVVNYQTQCRRRRRHPRQKRILKAVMQLTAAIRRQCAGLRPQTRAQAGVAPLLRNENNGKRQKMAKIFAFS